MVTETTDQPEGPPKSQRDPFELDFRSIHSNVRPGDVRPHDRVFARIRKRNSQVENLREVRVWRISPLGVELVRPEEGERYNRGDPVDLEITIAGQRASFMGLVVDLVRENEKISLIGIRFAIEKVEGKDEDDRRGSVRWLCSSQFLPTCVAPTPGKFDDYIYFQIRDVSRDGLQLVCSLRNKFLIPNMRLNITAVFPMGNAISIAVKIVRVGVMSLGGRDTLVVGTVFTSLSEQSKRVLSQYLIQFSSADSLEELRKVGMAPDSVALGIDFYNLKSEDDYREVLELRYLAHQLDGNVREDVDASGMSDIYDTRSRIVVGKHKGKIVATARIRFNELSEPLEHEAHVEWPADKPRRDQIVEVSRVATHPDFRKNDLLAALFRFTVLNLMQPERPWLVISCLDRMVPFYERIGLRKTGITHTEPLWNDDRVLSVMMVNTFEMVLGRNVEPSYWHFIWAKLSDYLIDSGVVEPTPLDHIRLGVYKVIGPIAQWLRIARRPKRRKG